MTMQEIQTRKEDQTFDCKSIQIEPKALAITIVAFANADGGDIAIGVSDKTRKAEGADQHTEKLNELLRVPLDFCNPSVSITSDLLPCTDKDGNENHILLMHIPASSEHMLIRQTKPICVLAIKVENCLLKSAYS